MSRTVEWRVDLAERRADVYVHTRRLLYEMGLDLSPMLLVSAEAADEALESIEAAILKRQQEWLDPLFGQGLKLPANEQGQASIRAALESFIQTCISRREAPFDALVGRR